MPILLLRPFYSRSKHTSGQALLDILIATGLFIILSHAVFSLVVTIYETMGYARTRLTARNIANQKMELLFNMPFNDLGTTTGIPHGTIPEFETINQNGQNYTIHTSITYVDDAFDNTAPNDLLPTDYKNIRIGISWEGMFNKDSEPIALVGTVSPRGVETSNNGGTLSIFVINAMGQPVPQAQVHIVTTGLTPQIDITQQTNNEGWLVFPGAPPCATCYHITATKDSYSTDKTYTTAEVANPNKRPVTISTQQVSEAIFVIDRTSSLTVTSHHDRESSFSTYPGRNFRLTGSKTIGTDSDGDPVYKFDALYTTDGAGRAVINNLEWDSYLISFNGLETNNLSGISPHQPFAVNPAQNATVQYALHTPSDHNLLLYVTNASGIPIGSASAVLRSDPDFIATVSSGLADMPDYGQAFFPNLVNQVYSLTVTHDEYQEVTSTVIVDEKTEDTIILPAE